METEIEKRTIDGSSVTLFSFGKYRIDFPNGDYRWEKLADDIDWDDKEKCFEEIELWMQTHPEAIEKTNEKLYAIYCTRCGEEIDPGEAIVISEGGSPYDTQECLVETEPETKIVYQGKYNQTAVEYLNQNGKEESRIKK